MSITRAPSTVSIDSGATSVAPPTTGPTRVTVAGEPESTAGSVALTSVAPTPPVSDRPAVATATTVGAATTVAGGVNRAEDAFSKVSGYSIASVNADTASQEQGTVASILAKGFVASASMHLVQDVEVLAIALLPDQAQEGAALAGNIIGQLAPDATRTPITIAGEPGVLARGAKIEVLEWSNDELVLVFIGFPEDDTANRAMAEAFVAANR